MGLFNFFKKGKSKGEYQSQRNPEENPATPLMEEPFSENYAFLKKYSNYFKIHRLNQGEGNFSPIAALEYLNGEITGQIYLASDVNYNMSAEEVIEKMRKELSERLNNNQIKS